MEEEFIKLEQLIDPVESGFLEHMELHRMEKVKIIDGESKKVLKQQSQIYKIYFDATRVSKQFNKED